MWILFDSVCLILCSCRSGGSRMVFKRGQSMESMNKTRFSRLKEDDASFCTFQRGRTSTNRRGATTETWKFICWWLRYQNFLGTNWKRLSHSISILLLLVAKPSQALQSPPKPSKASKNRWSSLLWHWLNCHEFLILRIRCKIALLDLKVT